MALGADVGRAVDRSDHHHDQESARWRETSSNLFQLEDFDELRGAIRGLAEKEIAPYAKDVDGNARFPEEALTAAGFNACPRPTAARVPTRSPPVS